MPKNNNSQLVYVKRAFAVYSPTVGFKTFEANQVIEVDGEKVQDLKRNGLIIPFTFSVRPYSLVSLEKASLH